jgi:hypothetical protein
LEGEKTRRAGAHLLDYRLADFLLVRLRNFPSEIAQKIAHRLVQAGQQHWVLHLRLSGLEFSEEQTDEAAVKLKGPTRVGV